MSDSSHTYERHSSPNKNSGLTAIIATLSVVDIALIITAIVLFMNVISGPAPSQASPKSGSATTDSTDDPNATEADPTQDDTVSPDDIREVTGAETFATPTGNIMCTIASTGVTCSIAKLEKQPKENAGSCEGYVGYVVELRATGTTMPCVAKAELPGAAGSGTDVLNYDSEKTVNNFKCVSSRTGMKCEDTNTNRGFTLARAGIKTF